MSGDDFDDMNKLSPFTCSDADGSEYIEICPWGDERSGDRYWSVMLSNDAGQVDRLALCWSKSTAETLAKTARETLAVLLHERNEEDGEACPKSSECAICKRIEADGPMTDGAWNSSDGESHGEIQARGDVALVDAGRGNQVRK